MSKAKNINIKIQDTFLEPKIDMISQIRSDTLQKVAMFLRNRNVKFTYFIDFLKSPDNYPGQINGLKLVFTKFLEESISEKYFKIKEVDLPINLVFKTIIDNIFGGSNSNV